MKFQKIFKSNTWKCNVIFVHKNLIRFQGFYLTGLKRLKRISNKIQHKVQFINPKKEGI